MHHSIFRGQLVLDAEGYYGIVLASPPSQDGAVLVFLSNGLQVEYPYTELTPLGLRPGSSTAPAASFHEILSPGAARHAARK